MSLNPLSIKISNILKIIADIDFRWRLFNSLTTVRDYFFAIVGYIESKHNRLQTEVRHEVQCKLNIEQPDKSE